MEEGSTTRKRGLVRSFVRRSSSGSRVGRSACAIDSYGREGGGNGPGGPIGSCGNSGEDTMSPGTSGVVAGQQLGSGNATMPIPGTLPVRGIPSRQSSCDLNPLRKSSSMSSPTSQQDVTNYGSAGGSSTGTTTVSSSGSNEQDWRKLVGSIRRKVRRKPAQNNSNVSEAGLQDTTSRNQDDFLKAAMRIFLVVSPPMGRVQIPGITARVVEVTKRKIQVLYPRKNHEEHQCE